MILTKDSEKVVQVAPAPSGAPWALENLPPFPKMAMRLLQLLSLDDTDLNEIGRYIAAEPVYAARVLQMANSPLFALQRQVKTISHAIAILGTERVKAITMTRALGDFLKPALRVKALRLCWMNSLACGLLSEKIARACGVEVDFAYTAGLIRDIGRLALLVKYPESYANLLAVSQEYAYDLLATERDLFEIDHCQAGVWLLEKMPLPQELQEVVARHHDETILQEPFRMVHVVRLAGRMADTLDFAVIPRIDHLEFLDVLEELPASAQSKFTDDPAALKAEIAEKIQAWA
jgi:putative nucleotidyltransferase with HDIG domain